MIRIATCVTVRIVLAKGQKPRIALGQIRSPMPRDVMKPDEGTRHEGSRQSPVAGACGLPIISHLLAMHREGKSKHDKLRYLARADRENQASGCSQ